MRLLDLVEEKDYPPCLVFQRGDNTLEKWMQKSDIHPFQRKEALLEVLKLFAVLFSYPISLQILMALIDLHSCRIVHRDLKPANVMFFTSDHRWKVLGLDLAVLDGVPTEIISPTIKYSAPEIIQAKRHNKHKVALETSADMWSFGIILFEVMAGAIYSDRRPSNIALGLF